MSDRNSTSTVLAEWSQVVSALVGAVAAIVAGVVGIQSNELSKNQDEQGKTQQTLQFFATFNAPSMLSLRDEISNEDWCVRYGYINPPPPTYTTNLTPAEIASVVAFFDAVSNSCGGQDAMCNQQLTDQLFGAYATEFYDDLSQSILSMRTPRNPEFGAGMAALAQETEPLEQVAARYASESCGVTASQ